MRHTARLQALLSQLAESGDRVVVHCREGEMVTVSRPLLGLSSSLLSPLLSAATSIIVPDLPASHLGHIVNILATGTTTLSRQEMRNNQEIMETAALLGLDFKCFTFSRVERTQNQITASNMVANIEENKQDTLENDCEVNLTILDDLIWG